MYFFLCINLLGRFPILIDTIDEKRWRFFIQRERNNRSIECLDFFTVGHHDVLGIEEYRILFKNIVSGWIGCCQCHFLDHHSENSSGRWARKIVIRITRSIQKCAFEQYSSCLDRLCPRTTICSKTKSSCREIFLFWPKNIFWHFFEHYPYQLLQR